MNYRQLKVCFNSMVVRSIPVLCMAFCMSVFAGAGIDGWKIVQKLPGPDKILYTHLPSFYRIPVTLSGDVAEEMRASVTAMGLSAPQYEEVFEKPRSPRLALTNTDYPPQTRDCVSGMLNPGDIYDAVLSLMLTYRTPEKFALLKRETAIAVKDTLFEGVPATTLTITPLKDRFGYQSQDEGGAIFETWLTGVRLIVEKQSLRLRVAAARRFTRSADPEATEAPHNELSLQRYTFHYDSLKTAVVPTRIECAVNGKVTAELTAVYRGYNQYLVFAQRTMRFTGKDGRESKLDIIYSDSLLPRENNSALQSELRSKGYALQLSRAAELSRKGTEALERGEVTTSIRLLREIIDQCPLTPQAVEAKKVLCALPR